jgi:hypothetical protein
METSLRSNRPASNRFGVQRSAFSVQRLAFGVWRSAFGVQGSAFGVQGTAFRGAAFQRSASILAIRGAKLMSFAGRREMAPVAPSQMSVELAKYLQ